MKKEIKVRRKRFFAFLLALVLICSSVAPTRIEAEDYGNAEGSISENEILQVGDVITVENSEGYWIVYYDHFGKELGTYEVSAGTSHQVQDYKGEDLHIKAFAGWGVQTVTTSGGYINWIELCAVRNDIRCDYDTGTLYIDAIYLDENSTEIDLETYPQGSENLDVSKRVYAVEAMQEFTGMLLYQGNTYANPGVELMVDSEFGVYNADGANRTIYAAPAHGYVFDEAVGSASYNIYGNYFMDADGTQCYDRVTFASGAIKNKYVGESGEEYNVTGINVRESEAVNGVQEYIINTDGVDVYNYSTVPVEVYGAQLWVSWSEGYGNTEAGVINPSYETSDTVKYDEYSGNTFAKSGEKITITPKENYSLYGINLYNNAKEQTDYLNWQEEHIEHYTNGAKIVTVPNISASLFVNAGVMTKLDTKNQGTEEGTDYFQYVTFEGKPLNIDGEEWYGEAITISVIEGDWIEDPETGGLKKPVYRICEFDELAEAKDEGQFESAITILDEGKDVKKTYVLLDLSLVAYYLEDDGTPNDIYNGDRYGEIILLTDTYNMDLESPVINADTGVTMTEGNSTPVSLKGSWQSVENTEILNITWTNQLPVIITVNADAGEGTPVSGYQIHAAGEDSGEFQSENTRTFESNGYYELYISVQDKYDEVSGRALKNHWAAVLGIDTIKPAIYYIDDNNNDANIKLSSNQEYQGTLYLFAEDVSSGVSKVTAYESKDGVWTENNDVLVSTDDIGKNYSILPTAEDKVYRIVVRDNAGNETVYDNLTVKAVPPVEPEEILIFDGGITSVKTGIPYIFGVGNWKVEGDPTSYVWGLTFYVSEDGEYNFIKE